MSLDKLIREIAELDDITEHSAIGMAVSSRVAALAQHPAPVPADNRGPALIDAAELARALNLPKSWLMSQARQGRIPSVRTRKYVRFDVAEVAAALRNHER